MVLVLGSMAAAYAADDLTPPAMSSIKNDGEGVLLSWQAAEGAELYRIYRKTADTERVQVAETSDLFYLDTDTASGTKYTYQVTAVKGEEESAFSSKKSLTRLEAPTVTKATNVTAGCKITWSAVPGAAEYKLLYRKSGASSWKSAGTTAGTVMTIPDESLSSGQKYEIAVRTISPSTSVISQAKTKTYTAAPVLTTVYNTTGGINLKWGKVTGASKYAVYRKTTGDWERIGTISGTHYIDDEVASGTKYHYQVKCVGSSGSIISGYAPHNKVLTRLSAPVLKSVSETSSGNKITWGKVTGATKYRVMYRKAGGTSWSTAGETTSTSYTFPASKMAADTYYYLTVKAISPSTSGYYGENKYIKLAKGFNPSSWGTMIYVNIDMQRLFYIGGGKILLESDIVSGGPGVTETPTGTYYINRKTADTYLSGPGYSMHVDYWMPFIDSLYGVHDASWRDSFGGDIWKYDGSHGCVNMPVSNMKKLWNLTSVGDKIVIE